MWSDRASSVCHCRQVSLIALWLVQLETYSKHNDGKKGRPVFSFSALHVIYLDPVPMQFSVVLLHTATPSEVKEAFFDLKGDILSKHGVFQFVIKVSLCFLKVELLQVRFINSVMGCFQGNSRFVLLPQWSWKSWCWQHPALPWAVISAEETSLMVLCHVCKPFWLLTHVLYEAVPGSDLSEMKDNAGSYLQILRHRKWIHKLWSAGVNVQSCVSRWESSVLSIGCIQGFQRTASTYFKPVQPWIRTVRKHPQNSNEWTGEKSWKSKVEIQQLCVSDPFLLFYVLKILVPC